MFDYRYHALSLAAVLFALALGVLIGVAIGDSNLVSSAKSGIVHDLESEISSAHHQLDEQRSRVADQEAFADGLYPLAVHGLLTHRSVGVVFLGGASEQHRRSRPRRGRRGRGTGPERGDGVRAPRPGLDRTRSRGDPLPGPRGLDRKRSNGSAT